MCKFDIVWVGLSDKEGELPLSPNTATGKIIEKIEKEINMNGYKTNLVSFPPLDKNGKLRYPTIKEKEDCWDDLWKKIIEIQPQIVFMLGKQVSSFMCKKLGLTPQWWEEYNYTAIFYHDIYFVPIHHPSYINVYKKGDIPQYIVGIKKIVKTHFLNRKGVDVL